MAASNLELFRLYRGHKDEPDAFYRALSDRAIEGLQRDIAGERVLDLGCGRGWDAEALAGAGADVVAMELDPDLVVSTPRANAARAVGDGRCAPFPDGAFDGVYCSNVLEHTPDPAGILDEIARITAPGGWIWISWTNWYSPVGGHEIMPLHYLGPRLGPKLYARLFGTPKINAVGVELWPTHVGGVLELVRANPSFELIDARPRYYPSQKWIVQVPGLRELLTWNCALTLVRSSATPDR